ncbi:MAG: preprotein translocase subunit SecG [Synergistaceae bacterium]|jgi:preprotein translocase subunit SecG|nr:preprotein translocase subunit SecG [Synergistaceae bacterium]
MMMVNVVAVLFLILCVVLMAAILTQHRKSGGFSGSFGGGGTQMDLSGGSWQRMSFMTKVIVALTAVFMIVALILVKMKL